MQDLTEKEKVDRLTVIVSGKQMSQWLTVTTLPSRTGQAQASAVFEALKDSGMLVLGSMSCALTQVLTGRSMGTNAWQGVAPFGMSSPCSGACS